jgi:hypothetical protein
MPGELTNSCYDFMWKNEKNERLGRPRYEWEDDLAIDIEEVDCDVLIWIQVVDWIFLFRNRE